MNEQLIYLIVKENLIKAFKVYGIEGTEQKIKELYHGDTQINYLKYYRQYISNSIY